MPLYVLTFLCIGLAVMAVGFFLAFRYKREGKVDQKSWRWRRHVIILYAGMLLAIVPIVRWATLTFILGHSDEA